MVERIFIPGEDDAGVLALRERVWGKDHPHNSAAYYEWLFRKSPAGVGSGIVAEHDGEIAGFAGICNRTVSMGDQDIRLCHGLDFMVDPSVSGALSGRIAVKVLNRHADLARDLGFDLNINFPNARSRRMIVSKRVNYIEVMRPTLMISPLRTFAASHESQPSALKRGIMNLGGRSLAAIVTARRAFHKTSGARIEQIDEFDESFDAFWGKLRSDKRLRFKRNRENLRWRFSIHPLHRYTILQARRNGDIVGYLAMTARELMGMPATIVVDLCVVPGTEGVDVDLIREAAQSAQAEGAMLLATQVEAKSPESAAFGKSGFLPVPNKINPKPFIMVAHVYHDVANPALKSSNWAFGWSDMDVV
jgi:hypothetical protein